VTTPSDAGVLTFDGGVPGLTGARQFVLRDLTDDGMFQEFVSVDQPGLALVAASPWTFFPDYTPQLPEADRDALDVEQEQDVVVFCSVLVDGEGLSMNLRAPFVVNRRTCAGRQVVLDEELPMRARLLADDPETA